MPTLAYIKTHIPFSMSDTAPHSQTLIQDLTHLVPECEVHVLKIPVPPVSSPVLIHGSLAVSAAHIQHKLAVPVGALVGDNKGRNSDLKGEEARGVVRVGLHLTILVK